MKMLCTIEISRRSIKYVYYIGVTPHYIMDNVTSLIIRGVNGGSDPSTPSLQIVLRDDVLIMLFQRETKLVSKSIWSIKNGFEHADTVHNSNAGRLGGIYPPI